MKWNSLNLALSVLFFVIILNFLFSKATVFYEYFYLFGIFQGFRLFHDFSFGLLPFASIYLVIPIVLFSLIYNTKRTIRGILRRFIIVLIWIVNLFYIFWAFNYQQVNLKDKLNLNTSAIDSCYIYDSFMAQSSVLDKFLQSSELQSYPDNMEELIRQVQEKILDAWGIPVLGRVRVRTIPPGSLLHFRTSGIYIPHAFEGHIDGGLYYRQKAFTMAHEMAHGYGISDESECNFIAYISLGMIDNDLMRYSAELAYWRYLAYYYRKLFRVEWQDNYFEMNPLLLVDLEEIYKHSQRFKDWMPKYRDIIYDKYLKTHGVSAGILSYDLMIELIKAYEEQGKHSYSSSLN